MGTRTVEFFRDRGITVPIHVVSGGVDTQQFYNMAPTPVSDLVLVCRLAAIKRIDLFLHTVQRVQISLPEVTATIVGDGALRRDLEQLAQELGLRNTVKFVGYQKDVGSWLRRAKVFVLTSDSEGLPLSTMEAMMCGLPVIASSVGDLPDLVNDGINGYLIQERTPDDFAKRILELLTNGEQLGRFARAARHTGERYNVQTVTQTWDSILAEEPLLPTYKQCAA
jgi:glycosyltransferase involved in cell wall biosynthesis